MKILLIVCSFLLSHLCFADLKKIDWKTPGDGLVTLDTNSGLYWLNLNYTSLGSTDEPNLNNTYGKIVQRLVDYNDELYGFRYASLDEVKNLYLNAGLRLNENRWFQTGKNATPLHTKSFIDRLGYTYINITSAGFQRYDQFGYTATRCGDAPVAQCYALGKPYADYIVIAGVGLDKYDRTYAMLDQSYGRPDTQFKYHTGHYLVSDINPSKLQ
ncbi:MAG: hypothetical protein IPK77_09680 [Cellvibrio sp.]|nr:hypothetical protein [Cellvibrio sp.]